MNRSIKATINSMSNTFMELNRAIFRKGLRVCYVIHQSATEPEQAGLVHDDRGTVCRDYTMGNIVEVRWDKGVTHTVSIHNLRSLDLLEELCDGPPETGV